MSEAVLGNSRLQSFQVRVVVKGVHQMGIGVSVFLMAVGAILTFAVEVQAEGFDINTVGVILMIVGCIGLLASMLFWNRMGLGGYTNRVVRDDYVIDDAPRRVVREPRRVVREREVVRQDDVL